MYKRQLNPLGAGGAHCLTHPAKEPDHGKLLLRRVPVPKSGDVYKRQVLDPSDEIKPATMEEQIGNQESVMDFTLPAQVRAFFLLTARCV